ncbi:hypothetical protein F5884DRAFT_380529 [Xylogone sp. PMI_703]|nr:hypothetical protein F5884DRAFT_380529 [Xylogone sp. PMI_703]
MELLRFFVTFGMAGLAMGSSNNTNGGGESLLPCGDAFYYASKYTCYDGNFLCPVLNGEPTLRCGPDCYLPEMYSCANGHLVYPPVSTTTSSAPGSVPTSPGSAPGVCTSNSTTLHLSSPPYENFFHSDCHSSSQVVVVSPLPDSNLTIIGPRFLVAWPAGNSGVAAWFAPENGINGSLAIQVVNSSIGEPLGAIYEVPTAMGGGAGNRNGNASVGISTTIEFNSSATLSLAILGSIRTIRDFTEGPSLLRPEIQDAIQYSLMGSGAGVKLSRTWLDNLTTTELTFMATDTSTVVSLKNSTNSTVATFPAGRYIVNATFNYPQLTPLSVSSVLSPASQDLIPQSPQQTEALSFLSYTSKLLAGAWRFLTYFGRDSMISALLLEPVLSEGKGGAIEAVIAAVLERVNATGQDGSVCHEETLGDYATWLNLQNNITDTAPQCNYAMIDSDYYLPILMDRYFVQNPRGASRASAFLSTKASFFPSSSNLTYGQLFTFTASKIVNLARPFAAPGNQTTENLMHLKDNQIVGQWRDSTYGIGGGRIPYDVNTGLAPAALRSIASLAKSGLLRGFNATEIENIAQVWEDETLQFFEVRVPQSDVQSLLTSYSSGLGIASQSDIPDSDVVFHALSLDGNNNLSQVQVMNTDDCFRHFLLNTTNQTQLTSFLNSTANNIQWRFPAGLYTDVGVLIANPAYGDNPVYAANWTHNAYHGTVIWSWPLAMLARGLELQLSRCSSTGSSSAPAFCTDTSVYGNVKKAYNTVWDVIEANSAHLETEVWSWNYDNTTEKFTYVDFGTLPPPAGQSPTESDIVQLWSLTFLAVTRDEGLR